MRDQEYRNTLDTAESELYGTQQLLQNEYPSQNTERKDILLKLILEVASLRRTISKRIYDYETEIVHAMTGHTNKPNEDNQD